MSAAQIRKSIAGSDLSPLDLMLGVLRDQSLPVKTRMDAASAALPYMHQKKPLAVEGTDKPLTIDANDLQNLSKADMQTMLQLLTKMGVAIADASQTSH